MAKKPTIAPICPACTTAARLTNGAEIYPHRGDLHAKRFWRCDGCGGYVGCHGVTDRPLGTPAGPELRKARSILHDQMIDPLWMEADRSGLYTPDSPEARIAIRQSARGRVYGYLAQQLGLTREQTHTGMFDLATCRRAWTALNGVTYAQIREWAKAQPQKAKAA